MISLLLWYLVITLLGWLAFPIAYRLLPFLPDRGYSLSRAMGLLLSSYLFWLLASLQLMPNTLGGMLLAVFLLAALGALAVGKGFQEIRSWLVDQKKSLLVMEVLFVAVFLAWGFVRGFDPAIEYTEKPMELAFINSILRSATFPPADPWLSGYAISYYYFGYVMIALLARLTGAGANIAFNLGQVLWFALTALGAYGLLFNLLAAVNKERKITAGLRALALLAPLFILVVSNLGGLMEVLHARGVFWQTAADGTQTSYFWQNVLRVEEWNQPPAQPYSWTIQRGGWVWWRSSRVLNDFKLSGDPVEIIDEFPFFSYLLGDMHPHVLAMPFVLLAIALALNLYYSSGQRRFLEIHPRDWISRLDFWLAALVLGGLAFLNTWDFPIYVALFGLVFTVIRTRQTRWAWRRIWDFTGFCLLLGLAGILLYLPFYFGFSSQAGGFLPSMAFFTPGVNFWVMFGPLLVPLLLWLIFETRRETSRMQAGIKFAVIVVGGGWLVSSLMGLLFANAAGLGESMQPLGGVAAIIGEKLVEYGNLFLNSQGATTAGNLFWMSLSLRMQSPGTWITIFALLILVWSLLARSASKPDEQEESGLTDPATPSTFVLLLALLGTILTLAPEFVFLRDTFGNRMNTIFKFYFQAWMLWSLAGSFGLVTLLSQVRTGWRWPAVVASLAVLAAGSIYPAIMLQAKTGMVDAATGQLRIQDWSLDGTLSFQSYSPDDYAAVQYLRTAPYGVIAEAVGGSYSSYARIAAHSGLPDVLGWPFHEYQWRGSTKEIGNREPDLERLYTTTDWSEALNILKQYHVRYIILGSMEKTAYPVSQPKFDNNLPVVFSSGDLVIYEVPAQLTAAPGQ
jgi:YYY domain-containing protein